MSAILSFIWILYLKQPNNILRYFCCLEFENSLFSNKLFWWVFSRKRMVYTAVKDQIKYFIKNKIVKITFLYVQSTSWLCCYCHKLWFFKYGVLQKTFLPFRELEALEMHYSMNDHHSRVNTSAKHEKTETI